MNFLNVTALFALSAIVIPVVLHLRRRRTAKVQPWAAMRFVRQSFAARRRGLNLEHLLLLVLRCLLISAVILATARPHVDSITGVHWIAAVLCLIISICLIAMAVAWYTKLWQQATLLVCASGMFLTAWWFAMLRPPELPAALNQPRDVVMIIDGSDSMTVKRAQQSGFEQAVIEAKQLIAELPGQSTAATLVAGPIVLPENARLTQNLRIASEELGSLRPTGGNSTLNAAIQRADEMLKQGQNSRKQIVVFSDDQELTWGDIAKELSQRNHLSAPVYARVLQLPPDCLNAAVTAVRVEQPFEGFGRRADLNIEVLNGGATPIENASLKLLVDEKEVHSVTLPRIESGARTSFNYAHDFPMEGFHVVTAICDSESCLAADNQLSSVVYVPPAVRVLVVDGTPSIDVRDRAATFARLAIDPDSKPREIASAAFARATQVDAANIGMTLSRNEYDVIMLCDVPELPQDSSDKVARFVANGGGLLILAGRHVEPNFYNNWVADAQPLIPGLFAERIAASGPQSSPFKIDVTSATHPSLQPLMSQEQHDLNDFIASAVWKLTQRPDTLQNAGLRFDNGAPVLVESKFGEGRVLLLTVSPDPQENNLTSRISFPVLMNLWVRYLASVQHPESSYAASHSLVIESPHTIPAIPDAMRPSPLGQFKESDQLTQPGELEQPDGSQRPVQVLWTGHYLASDLGSVANPGLYCLTTKVPEQVDEVRVPFVITANRSESDLTVSDIEQIRRIASECGVTLIGSSAEIKEFAAGFPERVELWKFFVVAALASITAESCLLRWRTGKYQEAAA